jgi:heme exporter protein B
MSVLAQTLVLLRKELLLEWRGKYALSGILLYVLSTVFVVYISFIRVEATVWNTLYWIIVLFAGVNAVLKSFVQETGRRQLYYYSLAHPIAVLLAKVVYNVGLLGVLSLLTWLGLALVTGNPVQDYGLFLGTLALGALGFSITFTFVSAIAVKTAQSATIMAILSFPVIIPILLLLVKMSATALELIDRQGLGGDVGLLVGIDLLLLGLSLILYPFLWRD